jgi:hypothetical protein
MVVISAKTMRQAIYEYLKSRKGGEWQVDVHIVDRFMLRARWCKLGMDKFWCYTFHILQLEGARFPGEIISSNIEKTMHESLD